MNPYELYFVTDDQQDIETLCSVVKQAIAGGVTMVQIREKHGDVRAFIERARAVKSVMRGSGVPLIINDRVDVALAVDACGVHLGQSDMPVADARRLLGDDKLLGLSVESEEQLLEAQSFAVDYLGVSAIFATPTKTNTVKHWGVEGLTKAVELSKLPLVAIGGINDSNIKSVVDTGVDGIALVSAISAASDPTQASKDLLNKMRS
ncbi:thiamine-phosphate diphosphorylase [Vibrio breoganii]|uniref:Thiamine-phosphate synthase n=1 Tax=Vibrio breoganii TaxID=553239 RepID=A0AAN0XXZ7_9VIBR|nr:thiamine phosphate synthase [Vibrio breoganii]ANO34576.1 thiamine-phosphate diphosphorylase [Vibrio breoganii]OCH73254.1 thiamine-phosphate diphosphorylase [Vibrio breoganii]PMG78282.1 thiamine-phosphate diphosphorylase [Vibrio breoganii]PMK44383.1 thiamine-phosphate diphosphorylase [Vibrio breoganii]PML04560.1 thiamine-phosphate diphosphorylase [Vibrio breoganii]